jgi:hypothetical protein
MFFRSNKSSNGLSKEKRLREGEISSTALRDLGLLSPPKLQPQSPSWRGDYDRPTYSSAGRSTTSFTGSSLYPEKSKTTSSYGFCTYVGLHSSLSCCVFTNVPLLLLCFIFAAFAIARFPPSSNALRYLLSLYLILKVAFMTLILTLITPRLFYIRRQSWCAVIPLIGVHFIWNFA